MSTFSHLDRHLENNEYFYRFVDYIFVSFNNINMSFTVSHMYGYWIDNFNVVITNIIIFSFLTNNNYVALEQTFLQRVIIIHF
jgi:hypothetical protein